MKTFILLCSALAVAFAADCNPSFKAYLDCIAASTSGSSTGKALEDEFDGDFVKHVTTDCFDEKDNGGKNTKCILSKANLDTDAFGKDGPLSTCPKCQEYAAEIKKQIFGADESVRTCFRQKFSAAVVNELQPCVRNELNNQAFTIQALPDFDKGTKDFLDTVVKGMSHRVMAYSRLSACKERYSARYEISSKCMADSTKLYPKHCALLKTCKTSAVTAACSDTFTKTSKATCKCLDSGREDWRKKLDKVKDAVFNDGHSATVCSSGVKSALGHWVQDFEDIYKGCVKTADASFSLSKLIDAGCVQAVTLTSDDAKNQLNTGFRVIRFLLDALNDRVTIFCSNCS